MSKQTLLETIRDYFKDKSLDKYRFTDAVMIPVYLDPTICDLANPPKYKWQWFVTKRKYGKYPEKGIWWYKKNPSRISLMDMIPKRAVCKHEFRVKVKS